MRLHNPNGLEPELKGIAVQNRRKRLIEPQILVPALQQIVSDANISQAARREGNSMLHRIEAP